MAMQTIRNWQNPFTSRLKFYYLSLLGAYLLVPLGFAFLTNSLLRDGFNPGQVGREAFFARMLTVSFLAAVAVIPLFGLWLHFLLRRAGASRSRFDLFFAAAPIGVPVFCIMLGWLNFVH